MAERYRILQGHYPAAEDPAMIRSNLLHWQEMQDSGYFDNHPCYQSDVVASGEEGVNAITPFMHLTPDQTVVVIGCGFGRESVPIARRVGHVYGIDVNDTILHKATQYTVSQGVTNFTPVRAAEYREKIPDGIALVFSIVVMQHLTRDLVEDYFLGLGAKLRPDGLMLVQFLEVMSESGDVDARLATYEPSVSWNTRQLFRLADRTGLTVREIRTTKVTPIALWHWAAFERPAQSPN